MTARIYARQSSGDNDESASIDQQVADLKETAMRMGLEVGGIYRDLDVSGRHYPDVSEAHTLCSMDRSYREEYPRAEYRKALGELLNDLQDGDTVLVYDVTRLMRPLSGSYLESFLLGRLANAHVAQRDGRVLDYADFAVSLTQSVLSIINDHQIKLTKGKSVEALNALKMQGPIGNQIPMGYRRTGVKRKFEIQKGEAEAVRLIFREYLAGTPLVSIVRRANAVKRTPGTIQETTIARILRRPAYCGMYKRPDGTLADTDAFPPIVSKADWLRVQDRLNLRKTGMRYVHESHPLSGMVFCGECGERMRVARCPERKDRKKRTAYLYCHRAYILKQEGHPRIRLGDVHGKEEVAEPVRLSDPHMEKWAVLLSGEKSTTPVPLERGLLPLIAGELCREASKPKGEDSEALCNLMEERESIKSGQSQILGLVSKGLVDLKDAENTLGGLKQRLLKVETEITRLESHIAVDRSAEAIKMLAMLRADCLPRHVYSDCAHRAFRAIRIFKRKVSVEMQDGVSIEIPRVSKNGGSYLPGWSLDVCQTATGWRARIIYHAKKESVLCDTDTLEVVTE